MIARSVVADAKGNATSRDREDPPPTKKKKVACPKDERPERPSTNNSAARFSELPDEILTRNIIPFIGDYQYRFVGLVNHALHDAYVTVYPEKQTYYSTLTKEHIKICYEENHCMVSLPVLFPLLAKKGDLDMIQYLRALDTKYDLFMAMLAASDEREMNGFLEQLNSIPGAEPKGANSHRDGARESDLPAEGEYKVEHYLRHLIEEVDALVWKNTCKAAAAAGHLHILEWILGNLVDDISWNEEICSEAAAHGHLHVLKWWHANEWYWDESTCEKAAKNGNLEILKWCRENGCPWDKTTPHAAAAQGHLEVLKWCHANGLSLSDSRDFAPCALAAENGHDEVLKWLHTNGSPMKIDAFLALVARGRLDLLRWFSEAGSELGGYDAILLAAEKGHLDIAKWMHENGFSSINDSSVSEFAAWHGHFEIVQYCLENNHERVAAICAAAAKYGSVDILHWCRANGCPWGKETCAAAAKNGHLELLIWCREKGCPWDNKTIMFAARNGHLEVVQWCFENGLQLNKMMCTAAAKNGHLEVIQWCRTNHCDWDEHELCLLASQNGHLEVLQWCHDHGCPMDKRFCMQAARFGYLDMVKWYHKHGIPCDEDIYVAASMFGQFKVQIWCLQQGVGGKLDDAAIRRGVERMGKIKESFRERIWLPHELEPTFLPLLTE